MYGDKISIEQGGTKPGKIIFSSKMGLEDALLKENGIKRRLEIQLRDAALALRADKVSWGGGRGGGVTSFTPFPVEQISLQNI